ncbi:hypothetical protein WN48_06488 [Eufriesea mexicana]|uniref:Peptidyl-prolyl cis-trans isomerase CWC27 like protein n=1 Tax=Eufriesea mexicana TaxID=516756 RepID=A0A310SPH8_9HYME|nr:hypothetical protein WN48_06488 [Eufriesea mexicana]
MKIIEAVENEQLVIVLKVKDKLNIESKYYIKTETCRDMYRNLETMKAAGIMGPWHMELIGPIKTTLKRGKRRLTQMSNIYMLEPTTKGKVNDRPLYPPILIKTIILNNPFSDSILRIIVQEEFSPDSIVLWKEKFCYRDFNPLSFGEEAEEDEEESVILKKKFTGKGNGKSAHDHLTDPKLSSQPAVEPSGLANK